MKNHDMHAAATSTHGLSLAAGGYLLAPVSAPTSIGESAELAFRILDADGAPVTAFETSHGKDLHLIVVRSDGAEFRHVHPTLDASTGTWSTPWSWNAAGTYRVFADFVPAVEDGPGKLTLSRTVDVGGELLPSRSTTVRTIAEVAGFEVAMDGELVAGSASALTITVRRGGRPVTTLQPYLGAFGHLIALRDGDLAYLHVHAEGDEPAPDETAGPQISFAAVAPTTGRYHLFLDFQVDGQVHTARFVLEALRGVAASGGHSSGHHH